MHTSRLRSSSRRRRAPVAGPRGEERRDRFGAALAPFVYSSDCGRSRKQPHGWMGGLGSGSDSEVSRTRRGLKHP
eukprot:scaffold11234_cov57-Phaeocystis_antarctica.AAC.3